MHYPKFFDEIDTVTLKDPLAELLGAFDAGLVTFSYLDAVKQAGHSCPTVAGAYLMTLYGLKALYGDATPVRGEIEVFFKEDMQEGVAGVIGNVISLITGATDKSGFKGLGGKFARHSLMHFQTDIPGSVRFRDKQSGKSVDITYDPSAVAGDPKQQMLMQKIMQNSANAEERAEFGRLWQNRVEAIMKNPDTVIGVS